MQRFNFIFTSLLLLLIATPLSAAYVTDKLLAGFYEEPDLDSTPIQVLPSGTPLELLNDEDEFTRVRLSDRSEGWMETRFISTEKPAQVMLLELQASTSELRHKLQQSKTTLKQPTASEDNNLKNKLADANKKIKKLSKELKNAKRPAEHSLFALPFWLLPTAGLLFAAGFIGGVVFRNYRLRKRLGGLRL